MRNRNTTWQEIKDRVEIKIGEEIDDKDFAVLANSALTDLNEVAYIDAPPMRFGKNKIMTEDEVEVLDVKDIKDSNLINVASSPARKNWYEVNLPFEYNVGYGELKFELDDSNDELSVVTIRYVEDENNVDGFSNIVILKFNKDLTDTMSGKIKIIKRSLRLSNVNNETVRNEMWVPVPSELSSIIKVEIISKQYGVSTVTESSLSSIDNNSYGMTTKYDDSYYYIHDNKIHIFTGIKDVEEVDVYFARRMRKVKKQISLGSQYVELENNFENLLTLSISHIWLENFVGSEDSETRAVFQKYLLLKKEYEQTNLPKRVNRKQTSIKSVV